MDKRKLKTNMVIIIILVTIIGGYVFFFLSPRIFNVDESSLLFTPISEPLSINTEHSVSVEMWKYSENESKMSVIISLDSRSANPSEKYVYQVMSRNKAKESTVINYDVVYQSSTFAYLMINSVPDDFTEVAVRVGYVDRHIEEGNNDENKNVTASFVTVYTNKNKVDKVVSINQLSIVEIYIDKINKEDKLIEDDISALKQDNELLEKQQKDILLKVSDLRKSESYLTESEQANVHSQIESYQSTYVECQNTIDTNKAKITEKNASIAKNKSKINELSKLKVK